MRCMRMERIGWWIVFILLEGDSRVANKLNLQRVRIAQTTTPFAENECSTIFMSLEELKLVLQLFLDDSALPFRHPVRNIAFLTGI
jgi:hypothetical protein